ncbi:hypothetical protein B0T14DRAFT_569575 [Immersiella caudata]|uniref:Uncharacterized protein n=1 Tax=Immersiella caudata TaxID=314043 RepID=A0AA39WDT2_9PEZI|nr:hypothetical protein B0T14DRAFT_569575 [Immersiella caudata]
MTDPDTSANSAVQGKNLELTDDASVCTSDVPDSARCMEELANSLFRDSLAPDSQSLERVLAILPELFRALALKIGAEEEAAGEHFEAMRFIHQKRRIIAERFEEYYLRDMNEPNSWVRDTSFAISPAQKSRNGTNDTNSNLDVEDPDSVSPLPPLEAALKDEGTSSADEDVGDHDDFQPLKHRDLVNNFTAFRWALHRVRLEINFGLSNKAKMDLEIYERWNRVVKETSKKGRQPVETNEKMPTTWEQLLGLVGDVHNVLAMLFDIQTDELTTDGFGARIRKSTRRNLEGWEFQHIVTGADPLWPKAALLRDVGLGWVDLVRGIRAITLFGAGFGDIFKPEGQTQSCIGWSALPTGKDLLATATPVIQDITQAVYRDPHNKDHFWELFPNMYWHGPDMVFGECGCEATTSDGHQCDRVQVLLPTRSPNLFMRGFRSPPQPFPD